LASASDWRPTHLSPAAVAYLQYTSGSTAAPKGVMVSHGNMTAQSRCITEAGSYDAGSVTLSWMPHFHDYGLVKGIIQPASIGRPSYLMSPLTFLKRPVRWLEAIQHYGVTHSGAPNFAYRRCVDAIAPEDRAELDLSGWQVASCGAEPIAPDTIERFLEAFGPAGFRREAFYPAYGMAEYTLLISLKRQGVSPTIQALDAAALEEGVVAGPASGPWPVRRVVGCGLPVGDTRVVIAHHETLSRCAAHQVGEIWLAGASTTQGYWNNPEETARTFGATLRDTGEGPFLRTGDLGFVKDGEVFVTGRVKDLLIVRGRNHYPQDLERTVESCHAGFRVGGTAAFSVEDAGEEAVVVVQELERQAVPPPIEELASSIRLALSEQHDLHVSAVVFIKAGSLPKTSSGKVQRRACREQYLADRLAVIGQSRVPLPSVVPLARTGEPADLRTLPPDARRQKIAQEVQRIIAGRLGRSEEAIQADQPIHRVGLDSLMAADVLHRVEELFHVAFSLSALLGGATINDLAATIERKWGAGEPPRMGVSSMGADAETSRSLSENQAALWFLSRLAPDSAAANVSVLLHVPVTVDPPTVRQALNRLAARHAMLRTTFEMEADIPVQRVHDQLPPGWMLVESATWDWSRLRQAAMTAAAMPFDLEQGPLWNARFFQGATQHWLLLVAHHIVVDGWSMLQLVEELKSDCASAGQPACETSEAVTGAPVPYGQFVEWHRALLAGDEGRRLSQFWKAQLSGELPSYDMLYDRPEQTLEPGHYAWHAFHLERPLVERLTALAHEEGTTLYVLCLAALQVLLYRYTD
ncbi:MAG: AMP-binding protein, partial [Nitrospira sp.]|nr:AMP-binding protein [Nitrospira sp.]